MAKNRVTVFVVEAMIVLSVIVGLWYFLVPIKPPSGPRRVHGPNGGVADTLDAAKTASGRRGSVRGATKRRDVPSLPGTLPSIGAQRVRAHV